MGDRNAKFQKKIADACQSHLDEPIRVVGIFHPHGTWGAFATSYFVNPQVGGAMRRDASDRAMNMPDDGLYALTDTNLHVCDGKPKGTGWKVKNYVGYWPRSSFTAKQVDGKMTDQVILELGEGDSIRLESMRMMSGGFSQQIIDALIAGSP